MQAAGVIFVAENGDGPGVRLKKRQAGMWKQAIVGFEDGQKIFEHFEKLFLANYRPEMGLFVRDDEGGKYRYVLTPQAAPMANLLRGEWTEIPKPLDDGWSLSIGEGSELKKRRLYLEPPGRGNQS